MASSTFNASKLLEDRTSPAPVILDAGPSSSGSTVNPLGRTAEVVVNPRNMIPTLVEEAFKQNPLTISFLHNKNAEHIAEWTRTKLLSNLTETPSDVKISRLEEITAETESQRVARTISATLFHQLKAYPRTLEEAGRMSREDLNRWTSETLLRGIMSKGALWQIDLSILSEENVQTIQEMKALTTAIDTFQQEQRKARKEETAPPTAEEELATYKTAFEEKFTKGKQELLELSERYKTSLPQFTALIESLSSAESPNEATLELLKKHLVEVEIVIDKAKTEVNRRHDAIQRGCVFAYETWFKFKDAPLVGGLVVGKWRIGGDTDSDVNAAFSLAPPPVQEDLTASSSTS